MRNRLTGLIAATYTPMHPDGNLKLSLVPKIVDYLVNGGVSGKDVLPEGDSSFTDVHPIRILQITVNEIMRFKMSFIRFLKNKKTLAIFSFHFQNRVEPEFVQSPIYTLGESLRLSPTFSKLLRS